MLLLLLVFGQTVDYKVLKTDVVNSQNYQFPAKFVEKLIPQFTKKQVYLLEHTGNAVKETLVGEVVCLHYNFDKWLIAKTNLNHPVPKEFVMRANFKIIECNITSGCNFTIEKADITRFILLSPLLASEFK
jgi:hypothetical protein